MTDQEKQPQEEKQPKERKERKGKQWVAQVFLENGKTKQRYFDTQEEADEALTEMLYELRRGMLVTAKDETVKQHFEHWLEMHKTRIRWSTYLRYRRLVNKHILPTIGHYSLQRLTTRDLDALYARKLEEGLSPISVEAIHSVVHMALKQAVRWRLIARNVSEDVSPPCDTQLHERQVLTSEQAQQLLEAATDLVLRN
jgi:integrase